LGSDRTDVEGRRFRIRKATNGIWIAVLLHLLLLPTELHAQVKDTADETPQGRSLEICDKEAVGEEEGDYACDEFIEANIEDNADTVKWLLDEIANHEEDSAQSSNAL
jgi:hypothetical protein